MLNSHLFIEKMNLGVLQSVVGDAQVEAHGDERGELERSKVAMAASARRAP